MGNSVGNFMTLSSMTWSKRTSFSPNAFQKQRYPVTHHLKTSPHYIGMPSGVAKQTTCVICTVSGRSDHIKRHVRTVHADSVPVGWTASATKVVYRTIYAGKSMERQQGICLACGTLIEQDYATKDDLRVFDNHVCKSKQVRSQASGPAPSLPTPPSTDFKQVFDEIMDDIQGIKWRPTNLQSKKELVDIFRDNVEFNTDDDVTDYKEVILQSIQQLVRKFNPKSG